MDSRTAVCVLTHDARFEIPLMQLALDLPVGYVGAMGSRRTHDERLRLLSKADVAEDQLPACTPRSVGLGAHTAEETALSIPAEIIAHTDRITGLPLSQATGPIHRPLPPLKSDHGQLREEAADPGRRPTRRHGNGHSPKAQAVPLVSGPPIPEWPAHRCHVCAGTGEFLIP
ncbi:XdhC family protein [Streptomyces sp. DSM 40750]|uniref:XdhC family protein n=1 Tax=Streptomyces sp. DSM 40750 TaxID=2801030 RepID=UPI0027D4626E|nr:XdhC family protein [Streptomyces sp. DSM 40750]